MATATDFEKRLEDLGNQPPKGRRGTFITSPGRFLVQIISTEKYMALDKEKLKRNVQDRNQPAFICEFKILNSDNEAHPIGSSASWYVKDPETANLEDVDRLMWALSGIEPRTVRRESPEYKKLKAQADAMALAAMSDAEALKYLGEEEGFLNGLTVALETRIITLRNTGGPFTVYEWSPAEDTAS
jgi:hypothetical protein